MKSLFLYQIDNTKGVIGFNNVMGLNDKPQIRN